MDKIDKILKEQEAEQKKLRDEIKFNTERTTKASSDAQVDDITSKAAKNINDIYVGDKVKLNLICPDDNETRVDVDVNLSEVNVQMHVGHTNEIDLVDDIKIIMSYPTLKDVFSIEEKGSETEQLFNMLKRSMYQIHEGETIHQNVDMKPEELDEFIGSLSTEHLEKINNFFETMPKLSHAVKVTNPKTKKKGEVLIEGFQSFFA